ncbi:hypothetical protein AALP_AAs49647U000100 [Arabis alpina]|uniref:Uncharacterized protein n=1 Tax=Arabis alpina TaxID=50452 RepID=A0A087G1R2_ARAAL|nr:hypothetical protein AALP_AAs49647U000100 [Arabis alpina]
MSARVVKVEGNKLWIRVKKEVAEEPAARGSPCSSRESRTALPQLSPANSEAPANIPMDEDPHPRIFKMALRPSEEARKATRCTEDPDAVLLRFWKGLRTEFHVALGGSAYLTAAHLADDAARLEKMGRDKEPGTFGGLGDPAPAPPVEAAPLGPSSSRPAEWPYFLNAYRAYADLCINPSEEAARGTNGWLEESDDESDIWGEVGPEWNRYRDSPPSATTPVETPSG